MGPLFVLVVLPGVFYSTLLLYLVHINHFHHLGEVLQFVIYMFTADPVAKKWAFSSHKLLDLWTKARWDDNTFLF